ncbi:MAG: hypothetical protein OEY14_08845, partial [Myxococcales bacterium]|nr:hypothetical protein [Myxococcales bacterium]
WDWPAYYLAFGLALHWLATLLARARAGARLGGALWRWLLFCAWVLFLFGGHFYAVHLLLGDIGHLHETFSARQQVPEGAFARHLLRVPPLMFTLPVLLLGALWLLFWPLRRRKRGPCPRDAIPLAFAFGGLLHFFLFKWSAIVHSYWAWNLNPYMAIALPGVLLGAIGWLRGRWPEGRRAPILAVSLIALALLPLAHRIVFLVPRARHAGGSMWFVSKARTDTPERYDAGRPELLFAEKVKEWTDRRTGVWIHSSFDRFRTEQRVEVTMDRVWRRSRTIRPRALQGAGLDGWVVIGVVDTVPRPEVLAMARQHPYRQVGNFFMLDLRREGSEVRIYELEEQPMSLDWAFLHTPFEAPLAPRRDETAEASMRRALER